MNRMKFRFHRGGLAESMATMVEIDATVEALVKLVNVDHPECYPELKLEDLRMKSTGPDERIEWADTWLVRFEGFGVIGMADRLPEDAPKTVHIPVVDEKSMLYRPNDGSSIRSFAGISELKADMGTLLLYMTTLGLRWKGVIKLHKVKPNRSIGWDEQWSIRNEVGDVLGFINRLPVDVPHECLVTVDKENLRRDDIVKVSAHGMYPVPSGVSAYTVDPIRSGQAISAGWDIMFESGKDVLNEVVLVNTTTGQRILVKLEALTDKFGN